MSESVFKYNLEKNVNFSGIFPGQEPESGPGLSAVVTGVNMTRKHLEIPDSLGGAPVRAIAPHAFRGDTVLRSVSLPPTLVSVGAFAFHDCSELQEITLYDGIRDFHTGAIRHDLRLEQIRMYVNEGNYTVMRDILSDTDAMLRFCLIMPDGEARLLFPGYVYAFAENTMARTIQFTISGCGMAYRECVRRKGISWREYDRQFRHVIPDDPRAAALIAADRLLYPYDLAPAHKEAYEDYLRSRAARVLEQFVHNLAEDRRQEEDGYARLSLMADLGLITGEAVDGALRLATDLKMTRACGIILSGREKHKEGAEDMLSLDDW